MNKPLIFVVITLAAASLVACAPKTPNDIPRPNANSTPNTAANSEVKNQINPAPSKPAPSDTSRQTKPGDETANQSPQTASKKSVSNAEGATATIEQYVLDQLNGKFNLAKIIVYVSTDVGSYTNDGIVSDMWELDFSTPGQINSSDLVNQSIQGTTQFDDTINLNLSLHASANNGEIRFDKYGLFQAALSSHNPGIAVFWPDSPQYQLFTFATDKVLQTKPASPGVYKLMYKKQVPLNVQEKVDKKTGELTLGGSRMTADENLQFQLVYQPAK